MIYAEYLLQLIAKVMLRCRKRKHSINKSKIIVLEMLSRAPMDHFIKYRGMELLLFV
jgi:hypothetical protein